MNILLFILALICFILTLVLTRRDRTNFINGILLEITIISISLAIYAIYSNTNIIEALKILIKGVMKYVTYFIAVLFIYNGIYNTIAPQKIRKNNVTDLLSLLAGITLIMINILIKDRNGILYRIIELSLFYIDTMFIAYILNTIIYKTFTKKSNYDVIIILGAGLIDGIKPSRTLMNRLNKAIEIYQSNEEAYIIVSGGKGTNEKISEAESMKNYLIENGIDKNKIILEDKSTNTYENFKYSKKKIEKLNIGDNYKIAFVSSDFHIYRSSMYAKQVKLEADGIGAKTLYYYFPNSFIREFAAIFVKYKIGILFYLIFIIGLLVPLLTK